MLTLTEGTLPALLQLTAGGYPTGAFSHSYGLETFVQEGRVRDLDTFGEWLDVHLRYAVAPSDGAAVALVRRAAALGDWQAVARIDERLTALKLAPEIRAASLATGHAALRAAREVFPGPALLRYATLAAADRARGNAATVFGCIAADIPLEPRVAVLAFLWTAASNLAAVATRLVPLGAIAAQRRLRELAPAIVTAADEAAGRGEDELAASAPSQEIAAFRHANLYSRLCIS